MNDSLILDTPESYSHLLNKCKEIGFDMPSDIYIGTLLKTLIATKPKSNILELGTGMSLSLSWMVDGMDQNSKLTSIDNDPKLIKIADEFFKQDQRVNLICVDGSEWIKNYKGEHFDLIFADAWPGKYSELTETLDLLKVGGIYIIDDMTPQPNWPEGHNKKAENLIEHLESRKDLTITKMNWSTGVIMCVKRY